MDNLLPSADETEVGPGEPSSSSSLNRRDTMWRKKNIEPVDTTCTIEALDPNIYGELGPLKYFQQFVDDDVIKHIVEQTNLFAVQRNVTTNFHTTEREMRAFLGVSILCSIVKMPSYRMYWSHWTRFAPIADAMPRNRFECIRSNLHLNNNDNLKPRSHPEHDRLFKVRPFVEKIRQNFRKVPSEEHNSIDEVLIPSKSRKAIIQYIKSKPHKWGIKVFARCSAAGFMNDFEIYIGKSESSEISELGLSGDVVLRLCKDLPPNGNYKIYTDNWFSSYKLACALKERGIWMVGVVRSNRLLGCRFETDKSLKSRGRGSFDVRTETNKNITAVKWYDNKPVHVVSSFCSAEPVEEVRRWSARCKRYIDVSRPHIVGEYNKYMGGVDLNDMLVALYRMDIGTKKYYLRIFYGLIDICIVNAWLLYRRSSPEKQQREIMSLLSFKTHIAQGLLTTSGIVSLKRGRPSASRDVSSSPSEGPSRRATPVYPSTDSRYDGVEHLAVYAKRNKCRYCKSNNSFSRIKCVKCNVNLCITEKKDCFYKYHKK